MNKNLEKLPAVLSFAGGILLLVSSFFIIDPLSKAIGLGNNLVNASCTNGCLTAGWQCNSSQARHQCGDFNGDGCLEWADTIYSCATGQTCTDGMCSGGGSCVCLAWVNGDCCNGSDCTKGYRKQTRTCTPAQCSFEGRIISDATCTGGSGTCTQDSECKMDNATCSCSSGKCLCCPTVNGVTGKVCSYNTEQCYYEANMQLCGASGVYCGSNTSYPHFKCEAETGSVLKTLLKTLEPNGSVCSYTSKSCCTGAICNPLGSCDGHAAPPVISNVKPQSTFKVSSDADITISADTNIDSVCKFSGIDQDYDSMPNTFSNTGKKFHSQSLGKTTVGEHTLYVRCKGVNCVKNTVSAVIKFTVIDAAGDKLAPKITNPLPIGDVDWENVTLSVETDEAATCYIDRKDNTAYADMETLMGTTDGRNHSASIDLTGYANATYTYYVKCKDLAGNTNDDSNQGKIIFTYTGGSGSGSDTTPPVISNLLPKDTITDNTPKISADTDENATCRFSFADKDYDQMTDTFTMTGGKVHEYTFASSLSDGAYTIYVRCKDDNGNKNTKSEKIVFTIDTSTTCTTDSNCATGQTCTGGKCVTSTTCTSDSGCATGQTCTGGKCVTSTTCTSDSGCATGQTCTSGKCVTSTGCTTDSNCATGQTCTSGKCVTSTTCTSDSGCASGKTCTNGKCVTSTTCTSDSGCATGQTCIGGKCVNDTTPPVISNPKPTGTLTSGSGVTLSVATDENATCKYDTTDKDFDSMANTFGGAGTKSHSQALSSTLSDGAKIYYVRCKDTAGNKNTASTKIEFTVDTSTDDTTTDDTTTDDTTGDDTTTDDTTTDDTTTDDTTGDDTTVDGLTVTLVKPTSAITVAETDFVVSTNHNAVCKLSDTDQAYASMPWTFTTTGGKTHSVHLINFDPGASKVYVRCRDMEANTVMSKSAVFTVTYNTSGGGGDNTIDGLTMTLVGPTKAITVAETDFVISTSHNAVCKLSDTDQAYASMPWTFTTTGGKTHSVHLINFDPGASKVYVRCRDLETGIVSSKSAVFTITYNSGGDDTTTDDTTTDDTTTDDTTTDDTTGDDTVTDDTTTDDTTTDDTTGDDDMTDDDSATGDDDTTTDDTTTDDTTTDDTTTDTTPPVISGALPTGTVSASPVTVSVKTDEKATCKLDVIDKDYDSLKMTLKADSEKKSHSIKVMALSSGDYKVYVRCVDVAGNKNTKSTVISFKVTLGGTDKTPPEISNPLPKDTISSIDVQISVETAKENATCKFDTQDTDYDSMASDFDQTGGTIHKSQFMALGDGNYTVYVRCKDVAGNVNTSSAKIVFKIDTTGSFNNSGKDTGGDDVVGEIMTAKGDYVWQNDDAGKLGSFPWVNWFAGYEFIPQKDGAITELCGFFDNKALMVNLYDESFRLLAAAKVNSGNNWNCAPISPVTVAKGKNYFVAVNASQSSVNYKYQCCNPSLLPRTIKDVKVVAGVRQANKNAFGTGIKRYAYLLFGLVDVKFSSGSVLAPTASDTTPPVITDPLPSGTISNNKPTISVKTDENATCRFEHSGVSYSNMKHVFSQTGGLTHTKVIGPKKDGTYVRYVRCKDAAGNKNTKSVKITFTIKNGSVTDTTPPVISNAKPTGTISDNKPTLSVTTDEDATCKYCETDSSYTSLCKSFSTTGTKTHSVAVGPLNDESYTYYVRCKDKAGNVNTASSKIQFTMEAGSNDTTPPAISEVKVSPASGKIGDTFTITAKVTDNSGVSSVKANLQIPDGTTVSTVTLKDDGNSGDGFANDGVYGVKWLSSGTTTGKYYIDIVALDKYNNSATNNNGATFTLEAGSEVNGDCKTLVNNGSSTDKLDITFVPCGYTNLATFEQDARTQISEFTKNIASYKKINFYLVNKIGGSCPSSPDAFVSNMNYYIRYYGQIATAACASTEAYVLLRQNCDGGVSAMESRTSFVCASTSPLVAVHEMAHAFFGIADEYVYPNAPQAQCQDAAARVNCSSAGCSKWKGVAGTGCYAGCTCASNYKSTNSCIMGDNRDNGFCPVCKAKMEKDLSNYK